MEHTTHDTLVATTQSGLAPFDLYRPGSRRELRDALAEAQQPIVFYAGGTDLFAAFREGLRPASLIWLTRYLNLDTIAVADGTLRLGAGLTHDKACADPALHAVPGLRAAWEKIATARIRRHATLGGNLMARRERYELPILLGALDATAVMTDGTGTTRIPVADLWDRPADAPPALLEHVEIQLNGAPRLDYARDLRPLMTQALVRREDGDTIAVATQWVRPWIAPADSPAPLNGLPPGFDTPEASRGWIITAGHSLLSRQRDRLA